MTEGRKQAPVMEPEELLTLDEAAEYLSVSKPTLYRMLDRGELKGSKVGRQWRFRRDDLDAYLARGPVAMTLSTVPMDVLDQELAFYAEEFGKYGLPVPEADADRGTDPWEQKITLLLTRIARLAVTARASDIHLEPFKEGKEIYGLVRFRIDGVLHEVRHMPGRLYDALILGCRTLTKAEPFDRPFIDARLDLSDDETGLEVRISIMPGLYGDVLTGRLRVASDADQFRLNNLGLFSEQLAMVRAWLRLSQGMIVVCGPTGVGKTTLIYQMLREIAGPNRKTVTVEDPVEYPLPWVTQIPIKPGVGFLNAMRAFLRHDVDVVMAGEMRDLETMDLAMHTGTTGHLVFITVHTPDTLRAIERIIDVFPLTQQDAVATMITNPMNRYLTMRLVRTLCPHCKQPASMPTAQMAQAWQLATQGGYAIPDDAVFYRAVGCDACRNTGYLGRTGIFELLELTPELRERTRHRAPYAEVFPLAVKSGMQSLAAAGIRKAAEGVTTLEEVFRVVDSL